MTCRPLGIALAVVLILPCCALGHEIRPAYLHMREEKPSEFSVLWKTPARGEMRLAIAPRLSGRTENLTPVATLMTDDAAVQTWRLRAIDPPRGRSLRIEGLEGTMTDALARIDFADGSVWTGRLTPGAPSTHIPAGDSSAGVAGVYLKLGAEHILLGIDHLLFVLALLIITRGAWKLVKTVTAFTIAHSITLGLATLGLVRVPVAPVEAVIALSIVFVAVEIVRTRSGAESLTARAPWVVAFIFGLLHGLGFAGALGEIGLPQGHIPTALLFFNVGVELGQLIFVAAVVALVAASRRMRLTPPRWAELVPPYAIGGVAMFWVIQRIAAF